jgi:hypothetical protein
MKKDFGICGICAIALVLFFTTLVHADTAEGQEDIVKERVMMDIINTFFVDYDDPEKAFRMELPTILEFNIVAEVILKFFDLGEPGKINPMEVEISYDHDSRGRGPCLIKFKDHGHDGTVDHIYVSTLGAHPAVVPTTCLTELGGAQVAYDAIKTELLSMK